MAVLSSYKRQVWPTPIKDWLFTEKGFQYLLEVNTWEELSVMMAMFYICTVKDSIFWLHVATEILICDQCDDETILIKIYLTILNYYFIQSILSLAHFEWHSINS